MKDYLIRIGCVLLGVFLTIGTFHIVEWVYTNGSSELMVVEELETADASITDVSERFVAIENLNLRSSDGETSKAVSSNKAKRHGSLGTVSGNAVVNSNESVSSNHVVNAPVEWKQDYPMINSDKTLEEKLAERSSYDETLEVNAFDKTVISDSTIDFSDVKISILGDSITTGVQLDEEEQQKYAYPVVLKEILGCKEVVNLGIGGSSVSRAGNYSMVERWEEIPKDSDIIIIFGGSNDCLFMNKTQFGQVENAAQDGEATFCGDLDEMASAIESTYRNNNEGNYAKLIYINPPSTILNDGVYESDPENMVHQSEFAQAINTIVPTYGFEVIDLYNNNILNSHDQNVNEQFVPDGIHPNVEGHRILAEHIASQIIQRIEQ